MCRARYLLEQHVVPFCFARNSEPFGHIHTEALVADSAKMTDRTVLITGANRGIGRATAEGLAAMGARVIMAGRSHDKLREAADEISRRTGNRDLYPMDVDLASQQSIREFADRVRAEFGGLHVLLHNAAVIPDDYEESADGIELQFAVNHLAPFLLTHQLLEMLKESAPSRIIVVSSNAHRRAELDLSDVSMTGGYDKTSAYDRSKLANVLFVHELADRLEGSGVTTNCVHPGVVGTELLAQYTGLPKSRAHEAKPYKSTEEGAETPIWAASAPELADVSGEYFENREAVESSEASYDQELGRKLWELSEELTRVSYSEVTA
ncbi:SDR family NAD(P)-dependent oxidoreductase [candidate division GN15 bacterium]|nr:SDR family NAD(P)-dependent oxidoreductase [candidate division GN15 bacterium]